MELSISISLFKKITPLDLLYPKGVILFFSCRNSPEQSKSTYWADVRRVCRIPQLPAQCSKPPTRTNSKASDIASHIFFVKAYTLYSLSIHSAGNLLYQVTVVKENVDGNLYVLLLRLVIIRDWRLGTLGLSPFLGKLTVCKYPVEFSVFVNSFMFRL